MTGSSSSSTGRRKSRAGRTGAALNLTPRALGWDRIHFAVRHLAAGASWSGLSRDEERCLVLLRGCVRDQLEGRVAPRRPARRRVQRLPARRLPAGADAVQGRRAEPTARSPIAARRSTRRLRRRASSGPRTAATRSAAAATRRGRSSTSCRRRFPPIACWSARSSRPSGNWSSYPPHKHDTDDPPREVELEEIYYYRFADPDGYGFQRLYDERRDRDPARHARRRRGRPRRLSSVCYSLRIRRLLPERAGRDAPIDGGQRRPALRDVSPRLAGARPAAAARARRRRRAASISHWQLACSR